MAARSIDRGLAIRSPSRRSNAFERDDRGFAAIVA
jgi:hypothetical protein